MVIGVPYEFTRNEFQDRLHEKIIAALSTMLGRSVDVEYEVVPELATSTDSAILSKEHLHTLGKG